MYLVSNRKPSKTILHWLQRGERLSNYIGYLYYLYGLRGLFISNYNVVSHSPVFAHNQNLWIVNAVKSGIRTAQMKSILEQLEAVLSHCSQVLVVRFDIGIPTYTDDNDVITCLIQKLATYIKNNYEIERVGYHWAREIERAKKQHYHCVMMLDANKIRHPSKLNEFIIKLATKHNLRPWIPEHCYYKFKRNDHNEKQSAIFRMSYLAKGRGKGKKPAQVKNYASSRIKPKIT